MSDIHKNFIGGEWTDGEGVSRNINPSNTDDVVGLYAQASAAQLDAAVAAARAAFPPWSRATPLVRHDALLRASAAIAARRDALGDLLAREEGKTLPEALLGRRAPRRSSSSSPPRRCAFPATGSLAFVPASRSR